MGQKSAVGYHLVTLTYYGQLQAQLRRTIWGQSLEGGPVSLCSLFGPFVFFSVILHMHSLCVSNDAGSSSLTSISCGPHFVLLGQIIHLHKLSFHSYADDRQTYHSVTSIKNPSFNCLFNCTICQILNVRHCFKVKLG